MTFGIKCHTLPSLCSFAACEAWFERVPEPRKKNLHSVVEPWAWRPLDDERMQHKALVRRRIDSKVLSYQLWLYDHPMVEFEHNGAVIAMIDQSDRRSSSDFAYRFLPRGISYESFKGRHHICVDTPVGPQWFFPAGKSPATVYCKPAEPGIWDVVAAGMEQRMRTVVDRRAQHAVRKATAELRLWHAGTQALLNCAPWFDSPTAKADRAAEVFIRPKCFSTAILEQTKQFALERLTPAKLLSALYRAGHCYNRVPIPNTESPKKGHEYGDT